MIERITKNEERLDKSIDCINNLEKAINEFKANKKDLSLLNKYYGSKNWFKDKEAYESNKIPKIKAGVLSEDAIWNMHEDLKEIIKEMEILIKEYKSR